ncbi:MAG: phosphotransferase family protein [Terriglobia bacterium]
MSGPLHETSAAAGLRQLLRADGVIGDAATLTPLSGGVSSEIYLVRNGDAQFVVKRALAQLKVAEPWFADVGRNRNEANYLRYVSSFRPQNVPRLDYVSRENGYFCMEYLGQGWKNWKQSLLDGDFDPQVAIDVADFLGAVHAHSSGDPEARVQFDTLNEFEQLRIEPYLLATARRHPALKDVIEGAAERLRLRRDVLVHGDFSPKNMLVGPRGVAVVDCEVAWYGDAAFDVAFLLNHLLLKSLLHPSRSEALQAMAASAWSSYLNARFAGAKEAGDAVLARNTGELLLLLLLARVDGKSPVEYLSDAHRDYVRTFAVKRLDGSLTTVEQVAEEWFQTLRASTTQPIGSQIA